MKVLPKKEFRELAESQLHDHVDSITGFIDKYTYEPVVMEGAKHHTILHELGHEKFKHMQKAMALYGRGRKNPLVVGEPWTSMVDDEIEAELYRFEIMRKRITPRVGLAAIGELLAEGLEPNRAISLVIARMRNYGIETSIPEEQDLISILGSLGWRVAVLRLEPDFYEKYEDYEY